jgi:hypothetical protein
MMYLSSCHCHVPGTFKKRLFQDASGSASNKKQKPGSIDEDVTVTPTSIVVDDEEEEQKTSHAQPAATSPATSSRAARATSSGSYTSEWSGESENARLSETSAPASSTVSPITSPIKKMRAPISSPNAKQLPSDKRGMSSVAKAIEVKILLIGDLGTAMSKNSKGTRAT